jgi:hypothetical protein
MGDLVLHKCKAQAQTDLGTEERRKLLVSGDFSSSDAVHGSYEAVKAATKIAVLVEFRCPVSHHAANRTKTNNIYSG